MFDEEGGRALKWRRRKWRQEWITKFAERQSVTRHWIASADLVDWCAQSTTTASRDAEAKAREVAYQRLTDSVRKGEFERDGRSKILYIDTLVTSDGASPRCRLTREQFEIALDGTAAAPWGTSAPIQVLNCCWLPRELARHWLESHGYHWSPHFEPPPKRDARREIDNFDLQLGWIRLTNALEIIEAVSGHLAWEQLKRAIRLVSLPVRCNADGVTRDLEPHWLDFLAFDDADDVLLFDRQKAWQAKVSVPQRARDVVVLIARCAELWSEGAWPKPGPVGPIPNRDRAERDEAVPFLGVTSPTGAPSPTPGSGMPGRPSLSKHLIEDEFRLRADADQALISVSEEAKTLLAWFVKHHPQAQRPSLKTIENNIRANHRRWKASRQQTGLV